MRRLLITPALRILDDGAFRAAVGQARIVGWPVLVSRAIIPTQTRKTDALNPFERVLFEVIPRVAIANRNIDYLSGLLLLPGDLVESVWTGLIQKDLLTKNGERGGAASSIANGDADSTKTDVILLFRDLMMGTMLPYVYNESSCGTMSKTSCLHYEVGQMKEKMTIDRILDRVARNDLSIALPSDVERIAIFRRWSRRARQYGIKSGLPHPSKCVMLGAGEEYLLPCVAFVSRDDGEIHFCDPFLPGMAIHFNRALERLVADRRIDNWANEWRESLVKGQHTGANAHKDYGGAGIDGDIYPRLNKLIRFYLKHPKDPYLKLKGIVENAFCYQCGKYQMANAADRMLNLPSSRFQEELARILKRLGMCYDAKQTSFVAPKRGHLRFAYGGVSPTEGKNGAGGVRLNAVMSLSLFLCDAGEGTKEWTRIAADCPDLLYRLRQLDDLRNQSYAHGSLSVADRAQTLELQQRFVFALVNRLLPELNIQNDGNMSMDAEESAINEVRARIILGERLDSASLARIPTATRGYLRDMLVEYERVSPENDSSDVEISSVVNAAYGALQSLFQDVLPKLPRIAQRRFDWMENLAHRFLEFGLGEVPGAFTTSNKTFIDHAMNDSGCTTLGACGAALALRISSECFSDVKNADSQFWNNIAKVCTMRGHGGDPVTATFRECKDFISAILRVVETTMEVVYETE